RRGAAAAALAAAAAHLPSLGGSFQFDDFNVIVHEPALRSGKALLAALGGGVRPLLKASYALSWALGPGPAGFHAFNIAVHALNAALIYGIGRRLCARWLGEEKAAGPALAAALLFALHPAQTEAVTYICGRSSSLMASFYLGAALLYLRGAPIVASAVLFVLAISVKETAITLPAALLLLDGKFSRRQVPMWAAAAAGLLVMGLSARYRDLLGYGFTQRGVLENFLTQVNGAWYLLARLTTLRGFNIDPGLPALSAWTPALAAQAGALAAFLGLGLASLRRRPELGFGLLWFFLQLAPTNSLVPRLDPANDRQLYLACWGPLLALAVAASRAMTPLRARAAAGLLLAAFGAASVARQLDYRSEIRLWEASVREAPDNARARNNLGLAYQEAGRREEALEQYRTALRLRPDYTRAGVNKRLLDWEAGED
ncbi:MAG: tetratricopeptide repeat protein, partial [Elusimicrobiota bacterium]|nr:tetratricopeptide repeat protein [Elusimicrobiota bacterium]